MGLDGVELVMAVEDKFQISIENAEASSIRTPGDLLAVILSKKSLPDEMGCMTQAVFYRLRRCLYRGFGIPRQRVRPNTPVHELLPVETRHIDWTRLTACTELTLPALTRPIRLVTSIAGFAIASSVGVAAGTYHASSGSIGLSTLSFIATCSGISWAAAVATRSLANQLAVEFTIADLTRKAVANNIGHLMKSIGRWNEQEIWNSLVEIISEQLGVPDEMVTRDVLFVEGLGLN